MNHSRDRHLLGRIIVYGHNPRGERGWWLPLDCGDDRVLADADADFPPRDRRSLPSPHWHVPCRNPVPCVDPGLIISLTTRLHKQPHGGRSWETLPGDHLLQRRTRDAAPLSQHVVAQAHSAEQRLQCRCPLIPGLDPAQISHPPPPLHSVAQGPQPPTAPSFASKTKTIDREMRVCAVYADAGATERRTAARC